MPLKIGKARSSGVCWTCPTMHATKTPKCARPRRMCPRKSSRNGATVFNITVFLLVFGVVLLCARRAGA